VTLTAIYVRAIEYLGLELAEWFQRGAILIYISFNFLCTSLMQ
jgi:hypothetical protein